MMNKTDSIKGMKNVLEKQIGHTFESTEVQQIAISLKKTSQIYKYRSFQYRFLHNAILLSDRLVHCGITPTNVCQNCKAKN